MMPQESPRQDLLPDEQRRRLLIITFKLMALTGIVIFPPAIVKWLRTRPDRKQGSSEPSVSSTRVPTWHPRCSAFHRDDFLTVCMDTGEGTFEQVTLVGDQARLWCLCGGMLSEAELVTKLARERDMTEDKAARQVEIFLQPLYQQGFLIAADRGRFPKPLVREIDSSLRAGEIVWQQTTD